MKNSIRYILYTTYYSIHNKLFKKDRDKFQSY